MEGPAGQIILFVLLIVLSIGQQIIKGRNKKARERNIHTETEEWEDTYTHTSDEPSFNSDYQEVIPTSKYEPIQPFSYDNDYSYDDLGITSEDILTQSFESEGGASTILVRQESFSLIDESGASNEVLDEFNLYNAIIYSEILKPKHEDY